MIIIVIEITYLLIFFVMKKNQNLFNLNSKENNIKKIT